MNSAQIKVLYQCLKLGLESVESNSHSESSSASRTPINVTTWRLQSKDINNQLCKNWIKIWEVHRLQYMQSFDISTAYYSHVMHEILTKHCIASFKLSPVQMWLPTTCSFPKVKISIKRKRFLTLVNLKKRSWKDNWWCTLKTNWKLIWKMKSTRE